MVITVRPTTCANGVTQERMAFPSRCTVHAPHSAIPQPYLVPCRPATSRSAHSNGMVGSASSVADLPLSTKVVAMSELRGWLSDSTAGTHLNAKRAIYRQISVEHDARKV